MIVLVFPKKRLSFKTLKMKNIKIVPALLSLLLIWGCTKDGIDPQDSSIPVNKSANLLAIGASAHDILSNDKYDRLRVEIAHVAGYRPDAAAIAGFEEFLRARTFKEDIEFVYSPLSSPEEESLTLKKVDALEKANRTIYTQGSTLGLYIYFADAPADTDVESENLVTLGAVYRNTSMIIYAATIRKLIGRGSMVSIAELEQATLNHEFGHLLGLVNLGTGPIDPGHEDTKTEDGTQVGNNHCNAAGCLMRAELEFGSNILKALESNVSKGLTSLPQLDAECRKDLRANGGR